MKTWEPVKSRIYELYIDQGLSLVQVREVLSREEGFTAWWVDFLFSFGFVNHLFLYYYFMDRLHFRSDPFLAHTHSSIPTHDLL